MLSAYEKQRLENIQKNQEQLKLLHLDKLPAVQITQPSTFKPRAQKKKQLRPVEITRRSIRSGAQVNYPLEVSIVVSS